jgi:hypothetical protein
MSSRFLIVAILIGAMAIADVIGYRDMIARDRILGSMAGLAWVGAGAYVWQVAAPTYSDATKAKILLFWMTCGSGLLLWWISETRARKMVFWQFIVWGAVFGAITGVGAWFAFYISESPQAAAGDSEKESNPTALLVRKGAVDLTVAMSPLIPDPNLKPANPDDLEFYFFSKISAAADDHIQYADVTVTNRTPRKMHLEVWGFVDYRMVPVRDVQFRWPRFSWRVFLGVMCFLAAGLPRIVKGSHDRWSLLFLAAMYGLGMVILVTGKRQPKTALTPTESLGARAQRRRSKLPRR